MSDTRASVARVALGVSACLLVIAIEAGCSSSSPTSPSATEPVPAVVPATQRVGVGTTSENGSVTVPVAGVGDVDVRVVNENGEGIANAAVVATSDTVAVSADGYLPTISLAANSLNGLAPVVIQPRSVASLAATLKRAGCKLADTDLGEEYVPFLSTTCLINDLVERGIFACTTGLNLDGRGGVIPRLLLLNATTTNILAIVDKFSFGVTSLAIEGAAALRVPWIGDAYRRMNDQLYPGKSVDYVTVNLPVLGGTWYTTWRCPTPSDLSASGTVSGSLWNGTLAWSLDNTLYRSAVASLWSGGNCDTGSRQDFSEGNVPANLNVIRAMPISSPISPSRRSIQVSGLPVGSYYWRVTTTRLDDTTRNSECQQLLIQPNPQPTPTPSPLSVTAISPNTGSTCGFTPVTIIGNGFQSGATVTMDGVGLNARVINSTSITATTWSLVPNTPRTKDVVVRNPNGQSGRLSGAYTYASSQSLNFNGTWSGTTAQGTPVRFTVENGAVTRAEFVRCGGSTHVFSPSSNPPAIADGRFGFTIDFGASGQTYVCGQIMSATTAAGTLRYIGAQCSGVATVWNARRQ